MIENTEMRHPQQETEISTTVAEGQAGTTKLYEDMKENFLTPLWRIEESIMPLQPKPKTVPWLWKWQTLYDIAERSGKLVPIERGGDRRATALSNPGLGGQPFATPTLWAAVQWLNGKEVAPAHRHTSQAIRFIINGSGSWSTVEGDRVFLERGDLVLTPPWLWHDHGSASEESAIWMDGLDIPLNNYLDASFFEPYSGEAQEVVQKPNGTVLKYGVGQMRPAWEQRVVEHPPMYTYKWSETEKALNNLAQVDVSPFDDVALEYINPHTGGPVMQSFSCWIQLLRPGIHTQAHRHTGSTVYHVFEGSGETIIDGVQFAWEQGDMFVVPSWAAHEHVNVSKDQRAILFSMHDTPLLIAMNKHSEQAYTENGGHQVVKGSFTPSKAK